MVRKILAGALILTLLFWGRIVAAAESRSNIVMQVTADLPNGAPVKGGQIIIFTIEVINNTGAEETVIVSDDYRSWSREITVAGNTTEEFNLEHTVSDELTSGTMLIFNFIGKVNNDIISNPGIGNFIYTIPENNDLSFDIRLGSESDQQIGGLLRYYATVTNNGNTTLYSVRITQSLDPNATANIDVIQAGQSIDRVLEYRIPLDSVVGQDVLNSFTMTAQGVNAVERQIAYKVAVTGIMNIKVVAEPAAYMKGSLIEIKVSIENPSNMNLRGILVRSDNDTRLVGDLAAKTKTSLTFHHLVTADNETLNFSVQDQQNNVLAATDFFVIPMAASATETTTLATESGITNNNLPIETQVEETDPWNAVISVESDSTQKIEQDSLKAAEDLAALISKPPQTGQTINKSVLAGIGCIVLATLIVATAIKQKSEHTV